VSVQRARLEDRIDQATRDIADVGDQLAAGEFDGDTASRLRATYEAELRDLERELADLEEAPPELAVGRSRSRMVIGAAVLVIGVGAVTYGVVQSAEPSGAAEGIVADALTTDGRDLSSITNEELEAVVAANPDIVGMRLALARRYFEAGELSDALGHYLEVVERQPHPEALANLGWITFLASDEYEVAERYAEVALELAPDWTPAYWYLANIRYSGLGDAEGAMAALQQLLARDGVPDEIRSSATELLASIEAGQ
jgi:tetratricopeptide (TPR) repeat protein